MSARLDNAARERMLPPLAETGWTPVEDRDAMRKLFRFKTFRDALAFMNAVGEVAEELNHHPEWTNIYNRVAVTLTTHDVDGLTGLDVALAKRMDAIAGQAE